MSHSAVTVAAGEIAAPPTVSFQDRRRTADRVFRGALLFNVWLTVFWVFMLWTGRGTALYPNYKPTVRGLGEILGFILFFYVVWGFIWYGVKALLLRYLVGLSKDERRAVFGSRMDTPFDVAALVARYSERRIRIVDMIGRRGRFITLAALGFAILYTNLARDPSPNFVRGFTSDNLFSSVVIGWVFLSFYYANNVVAAAMYGPQSRVMDGVLARANNLLITTLWAAFTFLMVPLSGPLSKLFQPSEFAAVFAMIWGSYIACDAMAEIGGSLLGKQRIRVFGIGDVNRKSVAGAVCGFAAALMFCVWVVSRHALPSEWLALSLVIAASNTMLELWSPRGTDDFTMATANALICWAFGVLRA
jgi:hypothetical protein